MGNNNGTLLYKCKLRGAIPHTAIFRSRVSNPINLAKIPLCENLTLFSFNL